MLNYLKSDHIYRQQNDTWIAEEVIDMNKISTYTREKGLHLNMFNGDWQIYRLGLIKANNQRHKIPDTNQRIDKAKEGVVCRTGYSLSSKTLYILRKGAWLQRNQNKWPRSDSKLNSFFMLSARHPTSSIFL